MLNLYQVTSSWTKDGNLHQEHAYIPAPSIKSYEMSLFQSATSQQLPRMTTTSSPWKLKVCTTMATEPIYYGDMQIDIKGIAKKNAKDASARIRSRSSNALAMPFIQPRLVKNMHLFTLMEPIFATCALI